MRRLPEREPGMYQKRGRWFEAKRSVLRGSHSQSLHSLQSDTKHNKMTNSNSDGDVVDVRRLSWLTRLINAAKFKEKTSK